MGKDKKESNNEEFCKICQNCGGFFQYDKDIYTSFGVCVNDAAFEPFIDKIIEESDFSCCPELYREKRYDGDREACDEFNEPEFLDIPEGDDYIKAYLRADIMKHQNIDEIAKYFYDSDKNIVRNAIATISTYIYLGNIGAYEELIKYYMSLGPAEDLEDVYIRMQVVEILSSKEDEKNTIDAYIKELARTSSNNTTRQLYTKILERLRKCPSEMVEEPLLELLRKKKYAPKMKNRILEVVFKPEIDVY